MEFTPRPFTASHRYGGTPWSSHLVHSQPCTGTVARHGVHTSSIHSLAPVRWHAMEFTPRPFTALHRYGGTPWSSHLVHSQPRTGTVARHGVHTSSIHSPAPVRWHAMEFTPRPFTASHRYGGTPW